MEDPPSEPDNLRFLRRLVTLLTATMILGVTTIVILLVIRLNQTNSTQISPRLPDHIDLPGGAVVNAVTMGDGWFALVTNDTEILVYDAVTGDLRQRVLINTDLEK